MDHFQGIAVEIISNGQVLGFYDDPDAAEIEETRVRHHVVEAVAGSTFQVKVDLAPRFNFYGMKSKDAVQVHLRIDGGRDDKSLALHLTKESLQRKFSRGQLGGFTFTGCRQYCEQTEQWMRSDYAFGHLVLKDTPHSDISVKQAQDLGKIEVTVTRVKMVKRQVARLPSNRTIETIFEVPEKALKGRPIDTSVQLVNAYPTSAPSVRTEKPKSISGEAGKPVVFNIYYRSRRALQMMGCIPRSPSPESQIRNDEAPAPNDITQEVRDLRARLALLERGLNVKSKSSSATAGVKRERDEERNEESRQRRRTSVKIEYVDLTDD